ncbi:hypothetical protein QYM36_006341, partial [Artemia franciscana]
MTPGKTRNIPIKYTKENQRYSAVVELAGAANAAIKDVVVVPMFEPRVSGYTRSTVITPTPTRGVRADVKTEDDWTRKVKNAPTINARYPVNA